jgi:hypothetical protein
MAQANTFTTPKGIAQYPHLSKPDTKFSEPKGITRFILFLVQKKRYLSLNKSTPPLLRTCRAEMKKQGKKELKAANPPYAEELGDDGQPTGNVIFKFKSTAAYKPAIFDAKGKPMMESNIWGGSEIRVNSTIGAYYVATVGVGVALRIRAVQVIRLVEGSGDGATRFGFEETVGYEHNTPDSFQEEAPVAKAAKPELSVVKDSVEEPAVVRSSATTKTKDISDIVSKWGAKD